jgi:hypothetical protein
MRKLLWFIVAASSYFSVVFSAPGQPTAPRFEDYPVTVWRGKMAPLDLRSHPLARTFRTRLREDMKTEGVNFAGHYTLATAGCGTGCSINAIIDARTGRAYFPNELNGWTGIVGDFDREDEYEQRTRPNSSLLRILGRPNIGRTNQERHGPSGIYYYEWKNNRLRLVKVLILTLILYQKPDRKGGIFA